MKIGCKFLVIVLSVFYVLPAYAQEPNIDIVEIESDNYISGTIEGISEVEQYKVVVYVKTDQWYVHPYAGLAEGVSWAAISPEGKWRIRTVRRDFPASKVAALLLPINQDIPTRTQFLDSVKPMAVKVKNLKGTSSYGDL